MDIQQSKLALYFWKVKNEFWLSMAHVHLARFDSILKQSEGDKTKSSSVLSSLKISLAR